MLCKVPLAPAPNHVRKRRRKERTLSFAQSKLIYSRMKILASVGSRKYSTLRDDSALNETKIFGTVYFN